MERSSNVSSCDKRPSRSPYPLTWPPALSSSKAAAMATASGFTSGTACVVPLTSLMRAR